MNSVWSDSLPLPLSLSLFLSRSLCSPRWASSLSGRLHQPAWHRALPDRESAQEGRPAAPGLAREHGAARPGAHRGQHQGQHAFPHQDVRPAANQECQALPRLQPGEGAQQRLHVASHDGCQAGQDRGKYEQHWCALKFPSPKVSRSASPSSLRCFSTSSGVRSRMRRLVICRGSSRTGLTGRCTPPSTICLLWIHAERSRLCWKSSSTTVATRW